jgi:alkylation response protein AidB-like acyl-CoA dehydrogenase
LLTPTTSSPEARRPEGALDARLSEEQQQIRGTAEQIASELGPESPEGLPARNDGQKPWMRLAELGFLGMRIPEEAGGSPLSGVEVALVAEQLGRFSVPLPFIGSAVCASELLRAAGAGREVLAALADGSLRLAPVLDSSMHRWARPGEAGIAFESRGAAAGLLLDADSGRLFAAELGSATESQDLTRELRRVDAGASNVDLGDLGGPIAPEARERALSLTLSTLAADMVGVMQAALDLAVTYTGEREQFGVKVGTFQALQHMAAEALVSLEAARGCSWHAAWSVDALPVGEALESAHTAKAYASEQAREVCETSIQMHGGIGMTWEAMPHVHLRRALLGRLTLGDERIHYARLADLWLGRREESP